MKRGILMSTTDLIQELSVRVGEEFQSSMLVGVHTDNQANDAVEAYKGHEDISFLWLSGGLTDPIYEFWRMQQAKTMTETCFVVFTDIKPEDHWADLTKIYHGTLFGTLYFMTYKGDIVPSVVPSQRGMYFNPKKTKKEKSV